MTDNKATSLKFIKEHQTEIIEDLLMYVPDLVTDLTDDAMKFAVRVLHQGISSPRIGELADKTHGTDLILTHTIGILLLAGEVSLKEPIYEKHMKIESDGDIKPIQLQVPQVNVKWQFQKGTLTAFMTFPDGTLDTVQKWKINY